MERTKKEILKEFKSKAPEIYAEILTEEEKAENEKECCGKEHGHHHGQGHGKGCGCGGNGHGRGRRWGGQRCGAGRPKMFGERKTITKQIHESTIEKIKEFSTQNDISENDALDRLINAGYESLNS